MRNKWIRRLFPIFALLLLLPWPIAYTYDIASQKAIRIEIAEPSVTPSFTAFGKAIGGLKPGDLFYIDATSRPADIITTLYIINAQDLTGHYIFMNLKVGVYVESNGKWEKASSSNGEVIPETILSMRNGQLSFLLPGYAQYKITIDGGCFYCHNADPNRDGLSPQFYLEVN